MVLCETIGLIASDYVRHFLDLSIDRSFQVWHFLNEDEDGK